MIFEKIIGDLSSENSSKKVVTVPFEWDEADRKILRKEASTGEEVGLRLSEPLRDGGILFEDEEKIVVLDVVPSQVIRIYADTLREMGRACFELGNRHLPLTFGEDSVAVPYERVTLEYMQKKHFRCEVLTEKFIPEVTVKGHSHD